MSKIFICHDFKTPRTDISRRLPGTMKVVPIMFYGILALTAYFGVRDVLDLKAAEHDQQAAVAEKAETEAAKAKLESERTTIESDQSRGEAIAKWVEGTRSLQPVTVGIARAIPQEVNLSEVSFERSADLPAQVNFTMRMLNGSPSELSKVEDILRRLRYRSHSPQQQHQGDVMEYRSTLVWQDQ